MYDLQYSEVGRLQLQKGDLIPTTKMEQKRNLQSIWRVEDFKLIPLSKGVFHVLLYNLVDQGSVMAHGALYTKSRVFRTSRWCPGFNIANHKITRANVLIRSYHIPLEYRRSAQNNLTIARGVKLFWKIDLLTLHLD